MNTFIENESMGDSAFQDGFILPVYSITEEKYTILIEDSYQKEESDLFYYPSFPLTITNHKLLISDISVLLDWDEQVFKNIPYDENRFLQHALFMENGNYSVDIVGYYKSKTDFGYKFIFTKVETLPAFDISGSIDSYNFNILQ